MNSTRSEPPTKLNVPGQTPDFLLPVRQLGLFIGHLSNSLPAECTPSMRTGCLPALCRGSLSRVCHLWTAELLHVSRATGECYRLSDAPRFLSDSIDVSVNSQERKVSTFTQFHLSLHRAAQVSLWC